MVGRRGMLSIPARDIAHHDGQKAAEPFDRLGRHGLLRVILRLHVHAQRQPFVGFNAGLEGNMRRAIDFLEGDRINERALKNLVRAAIEYNQAKKKKKAPARPQAKARKTKKA